jgi:hypothetical protein
MECRRQVKWLREYTKFPKLASYGLVYATGRHSRHSPVKKHSARRCSLHCYIKSCSYCPYNGQMLFWTVVQSRACAERGILTFHPPGTIPYDGKINEADNKLRSWTVSVCGTDETSTWLINLMFHKTEEFIENQITIYCSWSPYTIDLLKLYAQLYTKFIITILLFITPLNDYVSTTEM